MGVAMDYVTSRQETKQLEKNFSLLFFSDEVLDFMFNLFVKQPAQ